MEETLVTVVIPAYNMKDSVLRTARSVLAQPEAKRLELLLVDDGSKDGSGAVCDRFAAEHPSPMLIRVFHKENGGAFSAMNLGIREAKGRYICFLDSDDWWETGFFDDKLVQLLEEDFDLYNFSYQSVSPDMKWVKVYPLADSEQRDLRPDCDRPYYIRHWARIIRRELLLRNKIFYPSCRLNEDVVFAHLSSAVAGSIKNCSRVMLSYWLNPKSCVHTSSPKKTMDELMKSLRIEEEMFRERGFDYSNDRAVLSAIAKELPNVCSQMSYRRAHEYLAQPEFALLRQESVMPWDNYCSRINAYRKHPFLFWLRARLSPGVTLAAKRFLYNTPVLMRLSCFLRYRLRLRWLPFRAQDLS